MFVLLVCLFAILSPTTTEAQVKVPFPLVDRPSVPCELDGKPAATYRLSKDRPTVYISFEGTGLAIDPLDTRFIETGDARQSEMRGRDYWFRLTNNSVWAISLRSYGTATAGEPEMIWLTNGKASLAVDDGMEVAVAFQLRRQDGRRIPVNPGIDMFWTSWLPPGRSLIFSVPRKMFGNDRVIVVDYQYEWEESGFSEPNHNLEFPFERLPS